ncbi:hypothetical protein BKA63DRAFT_558324 [Paraphoma chrysanthemicola]|nr:hypothetical protein BKA63DRAFT_558324 [Paraphoma chrysanthemicola]
MRKSSRITPERQRQNRENQRKYRARQKAKRSSVTPESDPPHEDSIVEVGTQLSESPSMMDSHAKDDVGIIMDDPAHISRLPSPTIDPVFQDLVGQNVQPAQFGRSAISDSGDALGLSPKWQQDIFPEFEVASNDASWVSPIGQPYSTSHQLPFHIGMPTLHDDTPSHAHFKRDLDFVPSFQPTESSSSTSTEGLDVTFFWNALHTLRQAQDLFQGAKTMNLVKKR